MLWDCDRRSCMKRRIGFIGVGNMGKGICHNVILAGHEVSVFDVDRERSERFSGQAHICSTLEDVCAGSDILFLSLPNSGIVEKVMDTVFSLGVKGKLVIDLSTSDPVSTRKLYGRMKALGGDFVDSPLIAGPQDAWDKTLTAVVAGDKEVVDSYEDLFLSYCKSYDYVGGSGNGHLVKLAQNWAGLLQAVLYAQLYPVMSHYGLEAETLYDVLNTEFFDNWFFRFYSKKYVNRTYDLDFSLDLGLKDLMYMKKLCDEIGVPGFMLDGAIDLCRITLKGKQDGHEVKDMSSIADTMYKLTEN
ncbi:phosphogluconate dehydrogenase (decarboxylating), NAD binding domain protein [Clostridiales bacterium 1_7_47FAA]|nr:phosphogluconate dehydrogenase (decarboxylating), NAD binding domain protein [Clostridiales bacterium 1_7_47FAA]